MGERIARRALSAFRPGRREHRSSEERRLINHPCFSAPLSDSCRIIVTRPDRGTVRPRLGCVKHCAAPTSPRHVPAVACTPHGADRPTRLAAVMACWAARWWHHHPTALGGHEVADVVVGGVVATGPRHPAVVPRTTASETDPSASGVGGVSGVAPHCLAAAWLPARRLPHRRRQLRNSVGRTNPTPQLDGSALTGRNALNQLRDVAAATPGGYN